ncbi:HB2L protein, partial [Pomatorhinus ruficollis]|nr:HB2L protein [Pomatorhinus ruficollis]
APDLCPAHSGVFQMMIKHTCFYINGTEEVRYIQRQMYNREQLLHFDSDVGYAVGDKPLGKKWARYWNSLPDFMEKMHTSVDWFCRRWYEIAAPFSVDR